MTSFAGFDGAKWFAKPGEAAVFFGKRGPIVLLSLELVFGFGATRRMSLG